MNININKINVITTHTNVNNMTHTSSKYIILNIHNSNISKLDQVNPMNE